LNRGIFTRLQEKVKNSKRNGFPFSILFISLKGFKARNNNLPKHEMDAILRGVADCFKEDIRAGVDIAARMGEQDFLIAMPGSPLKKAGQIAAQIKNDISERVKAPGVVVDAAVGVAEYSTPSEESAASTNEEDELISEHDLVFFRKAHNERPDPNGSLSSACLKAMTKLSLYLSGISLAACGFSAITRMKSRPSTVYWIGWRI